MKQFNDMMPYEEILNKYYNEQIVNAKDELEIAFIERKLSHSYDVLREGETIMSLRKEFFESEDDLLIKYAKIALLLHDVGRFYQYQDGQFNHEMNHGFIGASLLKNKEGILSKEVYLSINAHDKIGLDDMLDDDEYKNIDEDTKNRTLLIAKLLKDADMYANLKLRSEIGIVAATKKVDEIFFTPEVMRAFDESKLVHRDFVKSWCDVYVSIFAWSSAFYFKETRALIVTNQTYFKIADFFRAYIKEKELNKEENKTIVKDAYEKIEHILTSLKIRGYV